MGVLTHPWCRVQLGIPASRSPGQNTHRVFCEKHRARPPRDGHMAFIRSPDGISIELLQQGEPLPPQEPWKSMGNTGSW